MTVSSELCQSPYASGSCHANCLALSLCGCASEGDNGTGDQADEGLGVTHMSQNSESEGVNQGVPLFRLWVLGKHLQTMLSEEPEVSALNLQRGWRSP